MPDSELETILEALPVGTVTFLLTDIERSSELWERDPDTMRRAVVRHAAIIEEQVVQHGGIVVKSKGEGDSVFSVFDRPTNAAAAAVQLQRDIEAEPWPTERSIRVRVALYTGEAEEIGHDYLGRPVNRCAHLRSLAVGGQILVSEICGLLIEKALPEGAVLVDIGQHQLKGISQLERVFQLIHPDLSSSVANIVPPAGVANNLSASLPTLVGRVAETTEVRQLLSRHRLVTLTGPGGIGKTRLAQNVAQQELAHYVNGVWFVPLGSLTDGLPLWSHLAAVLQIHEVPDTTLSETVMSAIGESRQLLVLDNCEHVLRACGSMIEILTASCRNVHILATSREGLDLPGEAVYRVPPLEVPLASAHVTLATLYRNDGTRLFLDRARERNSTLQMTDAHAETVAKICRPLGGLPLAIELAAGWADVFSLEEIQRQLLEHPLQMLKRTHSQAADRHGSMRLAIDWSIGLLTAAQNMLLRRLAIFTGSFGLDSAVAVLSNPRLTSGTVTEGIAALVRKSLVMRAEGHSGASRFILMETIREYALEGLVHDAAATKLGQRHADYFRDSAVQLEPGLSGPNETDCLARLDDDQDNVRAALEWYRAHGKITSGLQLSGALWRYWYKRGRFSEGVETLRWFLARETPSVPLPVRAKGRHAAGTLASYVLDYATARQFLSEAQQLWMEQGDFNAAARSQGNLGNVAFLVEDYDLALQCYDSSLATCRERGEDMSVARLLLNIASIEHVRGGYGSARDKAQSSLNISLSIGAETLAAASKVLLGLIATDQCRFSEAADRLTSALLTLQAENDAEGVAEIRRGLGYNALEQGHFAEAETQFSDSLAIEERSGWTIGISRSLAALGELAYHQLQIDTARERFDRALAMLRNRGHTQTRADVLDCAGRIGVRQGDLADARQRIEAALRQRVIIGHRLGIIKSLESCALHAQAEDNPNRAILLFGAASAMRAADATPLPPVAVADVDSARMTLYDQLGASVAAAKESAGAALPPANAVALALGERQTI